MTPRELGRELEAARLRSIDEYRRDTTLAWNVARFNASTKSKKGLQPLQKYLSEVREDSGDRQSEKEMLAALQTLSMQIGVPLRVVKPK